VIAIAPVTGQYRPGGRYTDLRDVNYFVIHGANDGDVSSFAGAIQYENVSFSGGPYRFKASLYVLGANHGQFNQVWGSWDSGAPFGRSLSTRSLIEEQDQRKIAEVYISAFLEATLRDRLGYLPLFADARTGAEWLPDTAYLAEFDDARSRLVAGFDEDVDVTTATIAGGRTRGEHLNVWREQSVGLKSRDKDTAGVYLGWEVEEVDEAELQQGEGEREPDESAVDPGADAAEADAEEVDPGPSTPRYVIELPVDFTTDPGATLYFSLADANESSSVPEHLRNDDQDEEQADGEQGQQEAEEGQGEEGQQHHAEQAQEEPPEHQQDVDDEDDDADDEEDEDEPREPIDLTVRLVDAAGEVAELPLSRFSMVQPQLEVQLRKALFDEPRTESETVFQSFLFPLAWFIEANPLFDASRPARIELVFDRSASGAVVLDSVGFRAPPGL